MTKVLPGACLERRNGTRNVDTSTGRQRAAACDSSVRKRVQPNRTSDRCVHGRFYRTQLSQRPDQLDGSNQHGRGLIADECTSNFLLGAARA